MTSHPRPAPFRAAVPPAAASLAPALALYLAILHPATLLPGNTGWLLGGTDNGLNALGLHAFLAQPNFALHVGLLNAPEGAPLFLFDANPLIALAAAPFAGLLPADLQFVGPFILLCFFLHCWFAQALLRPHAPSPLALWCGVALMALPTLFNRFLHGNLMAHWLILAALWLFVDARRAGRIGPWALLMAASALIHSYLFLMVAAIWASAMAERLFAAATRHDRARIVGGTALVTLLVAAIFLWLGLGGRYAVTGSYGAFAMPLDALWNPANPSFSTLLPATAQREGRGMEGFQYLGAGILLAIVAAIAIAWRTKPAARERAVRRRMLWLLPAMIVLTLVAISNFPDIAGHRLPRIGLPEAIGPLLDLVRASGRLFWPAAYALVFLLLLILYRLPARHAGPVLAVLLAVQAVDLSGMFAAIRATSAQASDQRRYPHTPDPRWNAAIASARDISFMPTDVSLRLVPFEEIAWRAVNLGVPVRTAYMARIPQATQLRLAAEEAAFARGELAPDRLYVLLDGVMPPPAARGRVTAIDGYRVILPRNGRGDARPDAISSSPR